MIYKFKSSESGDVIMLAAAGEQVLTLIGKRPQGPGILEPTQMPAALAVLQQAIDDDEALRRQRAADQPQAEDAPALDPISLRQRAWPLVEMIKRSLAADKPVVWGV